MDLRISYMPRLNSAWRNNNYYLKMKTDLRIKVSQALIKLTRKIQLFHKLYHENLYHTGWKNPSQIHYWIFSIRNAQAHWQGGFLTPWMSILRPGWPIFPYHCIFPGYPSIDTTVVAVGMGACNVTSSFSGHSVNNANTDVSLTVNLKKWPEN